MVDRPLIDRLRDQARQAERYVAPAAADQDPAAIAARHAAQDRSDAHASHHDQAAADDWTLALARHLPANLRQEAIARLRPLALAELAVRMAARADMSAWRRIRHQQLAGIRRWLQEHRDQLEQARSATVDLVGYLVRAQSPRQEVSSAASPAPRRPSYRTQLDCWRADPAQFHGFLADNATVAPGGDPLVDLARRIGHHRSRILAAAGKQRRRIGRCAGQLRAIERRHHAVELTEISRPVTRTAKVEGQPADLRRYHEVARAKALKREHRHWSRAFRLRGAHRFSAQPLAVEFAASTERAVVIGANGVDLSSQDTIRRDLADQGAWRDHQGRKPFRSHMEHLVITLAPGHTDRADLAQQFLFRAHRDAARLGIDLRVHTFILVQHGDTQHPHAHLYVSRIREGDSAVVQFPKEHASRLLALDRDILDREFQRAHGLPDESLFASIGGLSQVSRASSAAMERGQVTGSMVHPSGERQHVELLGQRAADRIMTWVGAQAADQMVPGGLAKVVEHAADPGVAMGAFEDIIAYLLRIR